MPDLGRFGHQPDDGRSASRPDFGRSASSQPPLDEILRSDDFIDALSTGRPVPSHDDTDALLAAMLGEWRDEMRWPPDTALISEADAVAALNSGLSEKASTRRGRRGLSIVGSAAAAMLCVGGFGAVVAGSGPGDSLYGLRTTFFGAPKQVHDDQIVLTTKSELLQVQTLISNGDWDQAQDKLVALSSTVESIGDQQQKQELVNQWNQLSARVVERNPEATVPPGITFTVPPSLNELVATPALTTVPSMPPITFSIPSELNSGPNSEPNSGRRGTGTFSPAPTEVSSVPSSGPESPVQQTSPLEPTSPVEQTQPALTTATPAQTTPAQTTPAPTTSVAPGTSSAAPTSQASSAPTSSAPSSPAPTSSAPASAVQTSTVPASPTSSPAPGSSSSVVTTTSAGAQQSAAAAPSSEASVPSAAPSTAAQTAVQPTKQQTQAVITTTPAAPVQSGGS